MKKLFLFLILLIAIIGSWFYAANKFEQIATNDILPKLKESPEIIYADPEAIQVNKYMFKINVGKLEILPDNPELSVTFEDVSICYNPIKDKISFDTHGDKISLIIAENAYFFENLKGNFKFNRSLLKGDISDFDIVFKIADSKLNAGDDNLNFASIKDGKLGFSYYKNKDDIINPRLEIDVRDFKFSEELNNRPDLLNSIMMNLGRNQEDTKKLIALVNEIQQVGKQYHEKMKLKNIIDDKLQYSLVVDLSAKESFFAKMAMYTIKPVMPQIIDDLLTEEKLNINISEKQKTGIYGSDSVFNLGKEGNSIKLKGTSDVEYDISDEHRQEFSKLYADMADILFKHFAGVSDLNSTDYLEFTDMLVDIKGYNVDINLGYNIESNQFTHDIVYAVDFKGDEYKMKLQGDFTPSKGYVGNAEFYRLGDFLSGAFGTASDALELVINKVTISDQDERHNMIRMQKSFDHISKNGFNALKVFHKGNPDKLTTDGKFESAITTDPNNFVVKINGTQIEQLLTDPDISEFVQGMINCRS